MKKWKLKNLIEALEADLKNAKETCQSLRADNQRLRVDRDYWHGRVQPAHVSSVFALDKNGITWMIAVKDVRKSASGGLDIQIEWPTISNLGR